MSQTKAKNAGHHAQYALVPIWNDKLRAKANLGVIGQQGTIVDHPFFGLKPSKYRRYGHTTQNKSTRNQRFPAHERRIGR